MRRSKSDAWGHQSSHEKRRVGKLKLLALGGLAFGAYKLHHNSKVRRPNTEAAIVPITIEVRKINTPVSAEPPEASNGLDLHERTMRGAMALLPFKVRWGLERLTPTDLYCMARAVVIYADSNVSEDGISTDVNLMIDEREAKMAAALVEPDIPATDVRLA